MVIAAFNAARWIEAAIASVQAQTLTSWVLAVVDDGSTDETWAAMQRAAAGDGRIVLHRQDNRGAPAARNAGYRLLPAEVEYLHFLDADDWLAPEALETLSGCLAENPQAGVVACGFFNVLADGRVATGWRPRHVCGAVLPRTLGEAEAVTPFEAFFFGTGNGPFVMMRKAVFAATRGWSEEFWGHNDTDMLLQMALEAEVRYLPERLYFKRQIEGSLIRRPGRRALYGKLRAKWDFYPAPDARRQGLIDRARENYYRKFRPARAGWTLLKRVRLWVSGPTRVRAAGVMEMARLTAHDLWFYTVLRRPITSDGRGASIR